MNNSNFSQQVQNSISKIDLKKINEVSKILKKRKSQIFLAGNGASASIANHVATDLTKSAGFNAKWQPYSDNSPLSLGKIGQGIRESNYAPLYWVSAISKLGLLKSISSK